MMARFFPALPPRSASLSPHRRRSLSAPNGPMDVVLTCSLQPAGFAGMDAPLLADVHLCGSLCPEFLRPGCSPT